ncbi:MAG: SDR family NAD(P)-dependent oxidoreductase [Thermodesulfovibrionales bacterium]|nr:SDR family NAD(P)-dependent oxidoreductase [Thermodesulfovibrionales bacterium]
MKLKDKVAIVTGSARGLGKAYALRLADEGAKIVVAAIMLKRPTKTRFYTNTKLSLCITSSEYLYPRTFSISDVFLPFIFSISEEE